MKELVTIFFMEGFPLSIADKLLHCRKISHSQHEHIRNNFSVTKLFKPQENQKEDNSILKGVFISHIPPAKKIAHVVPF